MSNKRYVMIVSSQRYEICHKRELKSWARVPERTSFVSWAGSSSLASKKINLSALRFVDCQLALLADACRLMPADF